MIPKESKENCISFQSLICAELTFTRGKPIPSFFKNAATCQVIGSLDHRIIGHRIITGRHEFP